jgi:hypothetical protein
MSAEDAKGITKLPSHLKYLVMILAIGMISAYDSWLTYIYSNDMIRIERNPLSRVIMQTTSVETFIAFKMFNTLFVCFVLFYLIKTKFKLVIAGVFLFQLWLFYYLNFETDGQTGADGDWHNVPLYKMIAGELKNQQP